MPFLTKPLQPLIAVCIAAPLFAFEQGSYHIFDLLETGEKEPIAGRIDVVKSKVRSTKQETASVTTEITSNEFVIDFSQAGDIGTSSGFDLTISDLKESETTDEKTQKSAFSTEPFNLESRSSIFGK